MGYDRSTDNQAPPRPMPAFIAKAGKEALGAVRIGAQTGALQLPMVNPLNLEPAEKVPP